mmetsp:Transcript_9467/g.13211  ORF Transcript_9467/g.13211 Transcript_9467/m.13211 type:complete len:210 (-) Transcript_9467:10-639(-)
MRADKSFSIILLPHTWTRTFTACGRCCIVSPSKCLLLVSTREQNIAYTRSASDSSTRSGSQCRNAGNALERFTTLDLVLHVFANAEMALSVAECKSSFALGFCLFFVMAFASTLRESLTYLSNPSPPNSAHTPNPYTLACCSAGSSSKAYLKRGGSICGKYLEAAGPMNSTRSSMINTAYFRVSAVRLGCAISRIAGPIFSKVLRKAVP